jgi:hypothetical protein
MRRMNASASRWRQIPGWTAIVIATGIACFWAFWGSIENFHEGWFHSNFWFNVGLMLAQYLSPMLIVMLLCAVVFRWPWLAFPLLGSTAIGVACFFHLSFSAMTLITLPLAAMAVLSLLFRHMLSLSCNTHGFLLHSSLSALKRKNYMQISRRFGVLLLIVCLQALPTLSASPQQSSPGMENELLDSARDAVNHDFLAQMRKVEGKALYLAGKNASRENDQLTLQLKSGKTRVYRNSSACNDPDAEAHCEIYLLVVYALSRNVFIVGRLYYESTEYLLIDDNTGQETTLLDLPLFSPSGNQILIVNADDHDSGNFIQLWNRTGSVFQRTWSGRPFAQENAYIEYKCLRWISETEIELQARIVAEFPAPETVHKFKLQLTPDGWSTVDAQLPTSLRQ